MLGEPVKQGGREGGRGKGRERGRERERERTERDHKLTGITKKRSVIT